MPDEAQNCLVKTLKSAGLFVRNKDSAHNTPVQAIELGFALFDEPSILTEICELISADDLTAELANRVLSEVSRFFFIHESFPLMNEEKACRKK